MKSNHLLVLLLCVILRSVPIAAQEPENEAAGEPTPGGKADAPRLGSPRFYPSPERPVGYRGDGTGRFPGATEPTTEWMEPALQDVPPHQKKNILWRTELNGFTLSAPIVVGDRVFTLEEPHFIVCLDTNTGRILWRRDCDHLKLFPPEKQARASELVKIVYSKYTLANELWFEYQYITGKVPNPYRIPGAVTNRTPSQDDLERAREIEKLWTESKFDKAPDTMVYNGHCIFPFVHNSPEYNALADTAIELESDYGIVFNMSDAGTQMTQHGRTQGTPTSDGKHIFANFADGQVACFDLEGKRKWLKWYPHSVTREGLRARWRLGWPGRNGFTGMSPLLVDGKLIVTQGYAVRALNAATGDIAWEFKYGDGSLLQYQERGAYKGPVLMRLDGGAKVLVFPQGYVLRAADGHVMSSLTPSKMFGVPWGNVGCAIMGLTAHKDICYFNWGGGCGAAKVTAKDDGTVAIERLWLATITEVIGAWNYKDKPGGKVPDGTFNSETGIANEPLYDPARNRLYLSPTIRGDFYCLDGTNGKVLARTPRLSMHDKGSVNFAVWPSNVLVNPVLVGNRFIFDARESGGTSVYDADDITKVICQNYLFPHVLRDICLWKPMKEIKSKTIGRHFNHGTMWWSGNDTHQTPSDIFVHGSKVFIRSVDALYCIGSETAHSPIRVPRTEN